jgi:hypothetical protein
MKRIAWLTALLTISSTVGCVERRFTVYSEPPGALVYINDRYLGMTPQDGYLTYYGKQQFKLEKEGYETLTVVQDYPAPWYEFPGIDFVTENIWPFKVRDVRRFCYTMVPLQSIPPDDVRARAEELRARGQNIGVPAPPRPAGTAQPPPMPQDGTLPAPRTVLPPPGSAGP